MDQIIVHTIFSAIKMLEDMEFVRLDFDKRFGRVAWENRHGDVAEIIVDKHWEHCTIDIYYYNGLSTRGESTMGKDSSTPAPTEPTPQEIAREENRDKEFENLEKEVTQNNEKDDGPGRDSGWK